ncbi:MAG: glycogen debranching protein [Acidobacteriaceae bacterium]|nr:glycogen debranching protein [Acidobacteriaceae bacterium]MBV9781515.1 glycogen debranching protein [Acidobacteriaceae bacterium]
MIEIRKAVAHRAIPLFLLATAAVAAELTPLPNFETGASSLQILSPCVPHTPWTVAGEYGALLGRQNGKFEAWIWPVKILSNFKISAELADYPVPIDVNALAAEIRVTPAETTITYSHAAFTVRQHMFAARGSKSAPPTGVAVFFEIESVRPLDLTFDFTPEMLRMWPAPNFGRPNGEWVAQGESGIYILHTDNPQLSATVAMPRTRPGILPPYQEHPQTYPLELKLSYDPARDHGSVFPLIMALASGTPPAAQAAEINTAIPRLYAQTQDYYAHFFDHRLTAETPDRRVNEALQWAEVSIDQMQVKHGDETGMVAGYYESADSARPGFGWFFGRDTLFTLYAVDSYGDFALTRRALDFLIHRQRADGKIMHEFSQSAEAIDWKSTPYFYAAADSTNLFIMAMHDYFKISGDIDYLRRNWEAVRKAYEFTRAHVTNGIYDNSQGTGWVESWPPAMPHQEIYLAALDQQSAEAMSRLAAHMNDRELSASAAKVASQIREKLEAEYFEAAKNFYAFSRNADGSLDHTATIYPSVAWWDGTLALQHPGPMLTRWASHEFSTDWGLRDISPQTSFYDPISYHQGSVWPLFTGWTALAEYRAGRPLSGYAHLMQNAGLTWIQDLGATTELLSGEFFQPLGRSSSHQMWSSAMIITPLLRGLFGLDWHSANHTLRINPQLPADWGAATLRNVRLGSSSIDLLYKRSGDQLTVEGITSRPEELCLITGSSPEPACRTSASTSHSISIPLKAVEIAIPSDLPVAGATTAQLKVLDETYSANRATFTVEAQGGAKYELPVRLNRAGISVKGAEISADTLHLRFASGSGYQNQTVTFSW